MSGGIWQNLWKRRVFHVVGVYLGISWALLEFVGFIVDQYVLSPHLITFCLVGLVSLLPSVAIVAFFHGTPGRQGWTRAEKVAVPSNLLVMIVLLVLTFSGKDLGAATTVVTVTDEEGVETERVIPKSEFRKRIMVFYFDSPPADTGATWLQYALPNAIFGHFDSDHFLEVRMTADGNPAAHLREAGFTDLTGVPLALQREIAKKEHRDHFVTGVVSIEGGEIHTTVTIHQVGKDRILSEREFVGSDVLDLAFEIGVRLNEDLQVPRLDDEEIQDFRVRERSTEVPEAFRAFADAWRASWVDQDDEAAIALYAEAVALDSTYAWAHSALANLYYMSGRMEEAKLHLQAAMDHLYRFSEKGSFQVKSDYYFIVRQDVDRAFASLIMWAELYPDDILAYEYLIQVQTLRNDRVGIVSSLEKILELDPGQKDLLLSIGDAHQRLGSLNVAREAFQSYADEFPRNVEALSKLAGVSRKLGELDSAVQLYQRALLIAPSDVEVMVELAATLSGMGDLSGSAREYEAALVDGRTAAERALAHKGLGEFYRTRGQLTKAVEHFEKQMAEEKAYQPGLLAANIRLRTMPEAYTQAGRDAEARSVFHEVDSLYSPPFDLMLPYFELFLHSAKDDPNAIEATLPSARRMISVLQNEITRSDLVHAKGRMHELRGEYREAIDAFEEEQHLNPSASNISMHLGRCYRELGDYEQAVALLQESLVPSPWAPEPNYELALTFEAMGRFEDARTHLERVLTVWEAADEGYEPAQEARAALARLRG